jgi:pyruvate,water dikinase
LDATFGLGEALVAGQVEPDHFVVNTLTGELVEKTLGAKKIATHAKAGGGVETVLENAGERQTLSESELSRLAALGAQIQAEFGAPQDIEWAFSQGKLYVLQSRPITSLFPVPELSFDPLVVWFSFGTVQGLVGPITPLGIDTICSVAAGAGAMFGLQLTADEQKLFAPAGQRIWIKISDVIRNPIGSKIFQQALTFVEPSVGQIIASLADERLLGRGSGKLKFSTLGRVIRFALPVLARLARNMLLPERGRAEFGAVIATKLATAQIAPAGDRFGRLANTIAFIRDQVAHALPFLLPRFIPVFGPSMAALNLLKEIAGDHPELALEVTRSLPGNVTTQMDLALWQAAVAIRAEVEAWNVFRESQAAELARRYLNGQLPAAAQGAIDRFMIQYGMRGVAEIDIGQPRWREDPTFLMHSLQSYLDIDPENSPQAQFARGERAALEAVEQLAVEAGSQRFGWLKEKQVRMAARRIRVLMGARESPKFYAVRTMGVARQALLGVGQEFAAAGTIDRPEDLSFLRLIELDALARNESLDWKALIAERRAAYQRELRRRQVPRVLVSDGRAFYEGLGAQASSEDTITGSPVSPGYVEGIVRVVLNPNLTRLAPGEILVCPGTDPAWTPLFMQAGGLITEVGGVMTHGSVVAREYGIPAVVGVHAATTRLKDGDKIQLDGTTGRIVILRG